MYWSLISSWCCHIRGLCSRWAPSLYCRDTTCLMLWRHTLAVLWSLRCRSSYHLYGGRGLEVLASDCRWLFWEHIMAQICRWRLTRSPRILSRQWRIEILCQGSCECTFRYRSFPCFQSGRVCSVSLPSIPWRRHHSWCPACRSSCSSLPYTRLEWHHLPAFTANFTLQIASSPQLLSQTWLQSHLYPVLFLVCLHHWSLVLSDRRVDKRHTAGFGSAHPQNLRICQRETPVVTQS